MSDSTQNLDPVSQSTSQPAAQVNALLDAASPATIFGRRASQCAGLVFGHYGGRFGGTSVPNGTVTATNSATNYVVVHRATLAVSISTANTNWNNTATYGRAYELTASGGLITGYEDHRAGEFGILTPDLTSLGDMVLASTQTVTGAKTFNDGKLKLAGSSSGALILAAPAAAGAGTVTLPSGGTLATTTDVAAAVNGLSWKQAARVATTANGTLATAFENGDTVDGVTLATGDRILIKNQSSGAENGIYVVAASGAPARATDADSGAELVNASVYVSEGSTNADTQWTCTTNAAITVDSTSLTFAQVAAGVYQPLDSDLTAIAGLTATSDNFLQAKSSAWASRTPTQVTADLIAVVGDSGAGGTKGLVPAPGSGDAAAGKFLKADGTFAVPPGTGGTSLTLTEAPSNQAYTGIQVSLTYGESLVPGDPVYIKSDGKVWKADANGSGTYPCVGLAMETASSGSHVVLLNGIYRDDSLFAWTVGGIVYLSTSGALTQTQPSATDDVIQIIGIATHADRMLVNPQLHYITHT